MEMQAQKTAALEFVLFRKVQKLQVVRDKRKEKERGPEIFYGLLWSSPLLRNSIDNEYAKKKKTQHESELLSLAHQGLIARTSSEVELEIINKINTGTQSDRFGVG